MDTDERGTYYMKYELVLRERNNKIMIIKHDRLDKVLEIFDLKLGRSKK